MNEMEEFNLEHTNSGEKANLKEHQEDTESNLKNSALSQKVKNANLKAAASHALIEKILRVTSVIKKKFPELSRFLEEIPEADLDPQDPKISLEDLHAYYESLNAILDKYKLVHSEN